MEDKARFVAVKTLYDIDEKRAFSNIKINQYFRKYDLSPVDRAFSTEILYGTIRWKLRIDYLIQKFSKNRLESISPWVINCIRIAVYQIFFMDRVPEFAAVDQSVEITKLKDKKAASFVNGVLRNILRNKNEFDDIKIADKIKRLSIEYSHPEWFIRKFIRELGENFTIELMKRNNIPPDLTIRVNRLKCTREELKNALIKQNVNVRDGMLDESLVLKGYSSIEKSLEFKSGLFIIQDESSMLSSKILDPNPGEKILDLCSAPGGKTTHIAELMNNTGQITAFDIHEHKLKLVNENAERLGISIIKTELRDALIYSEEFADTADRVLLDAPCSGLGLIRKRPEIRWNVTEKDINALSKLQRRIIYNASRYVKPGGTLVYSTCTITKEENEDIINQFIMENKNFSLENICSYLPEKLLCETCSEGFIKLFPNINNTDGFFISKLIRKW